MAAGDTTFGSTLNSETPPKGRFYLGHHVRKRPQCQERRHAKGRRLPTPEKRLIAAVSASASRS